MLKIDEGSGKLSINVSAGDGIKNNADKNGLSVNNDDVTVGVKTISTEAGSTVS